MRRANTALDNIDKKYFWLRLWVTQRFTIHKNGFKIFSSGHAEYFFHFKKEEWTGTY